MVYVNGLPLVLFELKSPWSEYGDVAGALNQIGHYTQGFARYLSEALPNARRLGFTGRPASLRGLEPDAAAALPCPDAFVSDSQSP